MGTRSTIAMKKPEGGVIGIYCHWDGYPDHNGQILNEHYADTDRIAKLIDLGDLSSLGPELGQAHNFDAKYSDEPELDLHDDWCMAYGRDRGEVGTEPRHFDDVKAWRDAFADCWCEWAYLWDGENWLVHKMSNDDDGGFPVFDFADVAIIQHQTEMAK
mgnify:FL=1|jgi:hypothetical protein|tara:strand:+ start:965 stop:1441 length:477 start_codon:yes stop_codon:yes gene_type:complete